MPVVIAVSKIQGDGGMVNAPSETPPDDYVSMQCDGINYTYYMADDRAPEIDYKNDPNARQLTIDQLYQEAQDILNQIQQIRGQD
jgi:hypothetical protein